MAKYCSQFCQHKDWASHHRMCSAAIAVAAKAEKADKTEEDHNNNQAEDEEDVEVEVVASDDSQRKGGGAGGAADCGSPQILLNRLTASDEADDHENPPTRAK